MVARDPQAGLQALHAGLDIASASDHRAFARLASLLERTEPADDMAALVSSQLAGEGAIFGAAPGVTTSSPPATAAAAVPAAPREFRVYRREAPVATPAVPASMPDWARGAAVAETIGPLRSADGRTFWFDFFRIVRLVPVYFAGESQPAFLFHLRERRFGLADVIDPQEIVGFLRQSRYSLERGSIWVRASLFASGGPAGSYIGLTVRGGTLAFTPQVTIQNGRLTIPAGGRCAIHFDLEAPPMPVFAGGGTARDEGDAVLSLPDTVAFTLSNGHGAITSLANAGWTVYGQSSVFTRDAAAVPTWEPALAAVLIPYAVSVPRVDIDIVKSPWASVAGTALVTRAGWMLQVATIDVTNPIEAAGIGGLAVHVGAGLTIGWRGLRDGPVTLPAPWIAFVPGTLFLTDANAASAQATQRLRLWQESAPPGRSTIDLRFARAGQLSYGVLSIGGEVLVAHTDTTAQLDRPVDVRGTPFPVHTLRSQLSLVWSDAGAIVLLFDDNILTDALSPAADWNVPAPRSYALAIRNALFTVTPVNSLALFAVFRDAEMLEKGTLRLGFGLYIVLPTLPDPYAANVRGLFFARLRQVQGVTQLLVAAVVWQKAPQDDAADTITTSFAFAPIGAQAESVAAWTIAAANRAAAGMQQHIVSAGVQAAPPAAADLRAFMATRRTPPDDIWDSLFQQFGQEQFSLLDVSSNADQMGVSFAFFDPRRLEKGQSPFGEAFGGGPPAPANPVEVRDLDLSAQSRFVRAFTVPQLSWEPMLNLTAPARAGDPPQWKLLFPNDGGPTRLMNDDTMVVPIAPIPVTHHLVEDFAKRPNGFTGALFTLPYGLRAFAEITRKNQFPSGLPGSKLALNQPSFEAGAMLGGIQIRADAPPQDTESALFRGCTAQMENLLNPDGTPTGTGTLGASVGTIFNEEFFLDGSTNVRNRGVPLTRVDFSGYGASIFSHWESPNAAIAQTSQARFDVFVGRTAHEVIQVRTLMYPWGIHVVRTITLFRTSSGYTYRYDSGWQPESDGLFDFTYKVKTRAAPTTVQNRDPHYYVHPGVVRGVFNVRNIRETDAIPTFRTTLNKANGDTYIDQDNFEAIVDASTPAEERSPGVELQPVYFDGDFELDNVIAGATGGRVPSKGIVGFVQLKPRGEPITPTVLAQLINSQLGSIGGAVACELNVAGSGQRLRVSRVDVSPSVDVDGVKQILVVAARGAVVLPTGGAWSVVQHDAGSGDVTPLDANASVPLIRRGLLLDPATHITDALPTDLFRLANPIDLVRAPTSATRNFGFLQTTGTQKALFRLPSFQQGVDQLLGAAPDFADAYRLINTKGIFPNVQDAVPLVLGAFKTRIIDAGYKLLDEANPGKVLEQVLPKGPLYLIKESYLSIYVDYKFDANPKNGTPDRDSVLSFGLNSAAAEGQKWLSTVADLAMVVDLGPIKRLVSVKGSFAAKHGEAPGFRAPELVFAKELQPVIDILTILTELQGGDYAAAMQKGLDVAMSNSADSWNYAFHARKEFPVVQFPPGELYYAPTNPFKIQAQFAVGAYFNESVTPTTDIKSLLPTAGAYLEFGGSLSVMCVSLAAATVYAVGSVDLRISGDTKAGPGLAMKFGFGAEIIVGLPVVGNVSLLYMVGVEVSLDLTQVTVTASLLFRGRAELLAGIVCITIQIEAKGSYQRLLGPPDATLMRAQVTFAIDVSIFLVINLHFSQSWQEQRQIA
jgi:hypothetical protein